MYPLNLALNLALMVGREDYVDQKRGVGAEHHLIQGYTGKVQRDPTPFQEYNPWGKPGAGAPNEEVDFTLILILILTPTLSFHPCMRRTFPPPNSYSLQSPTRSSPGRSRTESRASLRIRPVGIRAMWMESFEMRHPSTGTCMPSMDSNHVILTHDPAGLLP